MSCPRGSLQPAPMPEPPRLSLLAPLGTGLPSAIGPGWELCWRGRVRSRLHPRCGRVGAALLAASVDGGIHLVSKNLTLTGAAATAGLFWGMLYAAEQRMAPLLVSHVAWDIWIFLIAPTQEVKARPRFHPAVT